MRVTSYKRVYIASPCRSSIMSEAYKRYLDDCIRDSLARNEAPFAPHAYLTKYLPDTNPADRLRALDIGIKFLQVCQLMAVYKDHGISEGMQNEIDYAKANNVGVVYRSLV